MRRGAEGSRWGARTSSASATAATQSISKLSQRSWAAENGAAFVSTPPMMLTSVATRLVVSWYLMSRRDTFWTCLPHITTYGSERSRNGSERQWKRQQKGQREAADPCDRREVVVHHDLDQGEETARGG